MNIANVQRIIRMWIFISLTSSLSQALSFSLSYFSQFSGSYLHREKFSSLKCRMSWGWLRLRRGGDDSTVVVVSPTVVQWWLGLQRLADGYVYLFSCLRLLSLSDCSVLCLFVVSIVCWLGFGLNFVWCGCIFSGFWYVALVLLEIFYLSFCCF